MDEQSKVCLESDHVQHCPADEVDCQECAVSAVLTSSALPGPYPLLVIMLVQT